MVPQATRPSKGEAHVDRKHETQQVPIMGVRMDIYNTAYGMYEYGVGPS